MRSAVRRKAPRGQAIVNGASVPAPTGGWDAVSPIANMKIDRAIVLDNWFPTPQGVRVRRGSTEFATGAGTGVVESLLEYHAVNPVNSKLFACANNIIYDISAGGAASSSVTGLNSNRWQHVDFTTAAGHFLWCCNGVDDPKHYNGSAWATPSLSITTYSGADIISVYAHNKRLWFIFKNSTVAGYLPVESIAGTVTNFDFGALFTKGGYLVAMATWTRDGGSGADDFAVFISSEGQCAVYQGTDPATADTWAIVGVFDLGPPIGIRCFTKVAGDLALVNIDGVVPLSKALGQDRGAAAAIAITRNINNAMNDAARLYKANFGWQLCPYPRGTYVLLNVPIQEGQSQHQYVMNTLTGAWCRFTGQNANCWAVWKDNLYFGGNDGKVYKADFGSTDSGTEIDAVGQSAYSYYNKSGQLKQWKLIQPIITTSSTERPAIGVSTDFKDNASLGTPSVSIQAQATYDSAVWDEAVFPVESQTIADWTSISGDGYCASTHFRSKTNDTGEVEIQLNGFNVIYEQGLVL